MRGGGRQRNHTLQAVRQCAMGRVGRLSLHVGVPCVLLALAPLARAAAVGKGPCEAGHCSASEEAEWAPPVVWYAPFLSASGYGSEAISFVMALERETSVAAVQHGDGISAEHVDGLPSRTREALGRMLRAAVPMESAVAICHSEPGAWHPARYPTSRCPPAGAFRAVGRSMFESDRLPEGWAERLNGMDAVWVPTQFQAAVFESGGVDRDRLRVVGEAVDTAFFDARLAAQPLPIAGSRPGDVRLCSVFKWEWRKGWDVLLSAFFTEFGARDEVALVVLASAYHSDADFEGRIRRYCEAEGMACDARVHVLSGLSAVELRAFYAGCSALVQPSRGEGWGRPHVEAMSMGVPVIATNWSGPTAYLTRRNGYPLRYDGLVAMPDGPFQGHRFAQPSKTHLRDLMRRVVTEPQDARARGLRAARDMRARFTPRHLARRILYLLRDVVARGPAAAARPR